MSWKDDNAIKRIFNTFKRNNKTIFQQDVDALKQLKESIEESEKKTAIDNKLFLKLLIVLMTEYLNYYGNMEIVIRELSITMQQPTNLLILNLQSALNINDNLEFLKEKGLDFDNLYKSELEFIEDNQKEIIENMLKSWTYEKVEKSVYRSANDFIKDIENYK